MNGGGADNNLTYGEAIVGEGTLDVNVNKPNYPSDGTYKYYIDGVEVEESSLVNAGNHEYYVVYTNDDGVSVQSETFKLVIAQRNLTVSNTVVNNKDYDGNTTATIYEYGDLANAVPGTEVEIDTAMATFDTPDFGEDKNVTVTYILSGKDASNYNVQNSTVKATINEKDMAFEWSTTNPTYGYKFGEDIVATYIGTDVEEGGTYTYYIDGKPVVAPCLIPAGNHTITVVYTNDEGVDITHSFGYDVAKKELTITETTVKEKVYDGTPVGTLEQLGTITAGLVGGDIVTIDSLGTIVMFEDPDSGTGKKVTVEFKLAGPDTSNYFVPALILTNGIIEKATPTIDQYSVSKPDTLIYDGFEKNVVIGGPGEFEVYYSNDGGNTWTANKPVDAGEYVVKVQFRNAKGEMSPVYPFSIKLNLTKRYITDI